MRPHNLSIFASICFVLTLNSQLITAQKPKAPPGGKLAIVVDDRLSALRSAPNLHANLIHRLRQGRPLAVKAIKTSDGLVFFLVNASRRTHGWIQREAVVIPSRRGD